MSEDAIAVQQAQLADMPFEVIEGWLMAHGWVVVSRDWHRRHMALDALKAAQHARQEPNTALYDAQAQRWVGPLGKKWPVEGGDE